MNDIQYSLLRIYDRYRTSLLNVKYYGYKLKWAQRFNFWIEITIAVSSAGGVSGWAIWNTHGGAPIWSFIVAASAVLAAIKPILALGEKISKCSNKYGGHYQNYLTLKDIVEQISMQHNLTPEMEREFEHVTKQHRLMALDDDPRPPKRLVEKFQDEVNRQIPPDSLWFPAT